MLAPTVGTEILPPASRYAAAVIKLPALQSVRDHFVGIQRLNAYWPLLRMNLDLMGA